MASTAPEPEAFRVTNIKLIEDDESSPAPVLVATIMVAGEPHDVTLNAETMTVDTDAFSGSGLDYNDIEDINDAVDNYRNSEDIKPPQELASASQGIGSEDAQPALEVLRVDVVRDSDNLFPPTPVAVIKYNQSEHDVTLDPETLRVDSQTFDTSGLPRDDIDLVDDCIQVYKAKEQIEPTISEKMLDEMVGKLSQKTGVDYSFHFHSGDQYQLDEYSEADHSWMRAASYDGLGAAWMGVQNLIDQAPELEIEQLEIEINPVDLDQLDLDHFSGPIVNAVNTFPGGIRTLPAAEAVLNTYKHDLTLALDPQTLRVDVGNSHAPNFELDDKALARIHGEIDNLMIDEGLQPPLSEDTVAAVADGLEHLTGELHDFRQVGDRWELRKRDEDNNWQQVKQYADIPEAYLDVIQRSHVAELKIDNPPAGEALGAVLDQLDKNTALEIKPVDPGAPAEPVDQLQAGPSDLKSGIDNMRKAVAEAPIGRAHSANGSRLPPELVDKTLQMMLAQLDRNEEQQKQAVKR